MRPMIKKISRIPRRYGLAIKAALLVAMVASVIWTGAAPAGAIPTIDRQIQLIASDGVYMMMPDGREVYNFGFAAAPWDATWDELMALRGQATSPGPLMVFTEGERIQLRLNNVGFSVRWDIPDPHTIHWHGFPNAYPIYDGVPEFSVMVPQYRSFDYYYEAPEAGTYFWHCHMEPIEHIQMGMVGPLIVRPAGHPNWAYNDSSTEFDREYFLFLNEVDSTAHVLTETYQTVDWSEYKPDYFVINGRAYPDTIKPNHDPSLPLQPLTSLIKANSGDRVLLRFGDVGFEQHVLQLPGINMHVIGRDAKQLKAEGLGGGADISYWTNTIYSAPGTSLEILFTAPTVTTLTKFKLYSRNVNQLTNDGTPGGLATEVWVYPAGTLPAQTGPNDLLPGDLP